MQRVASFNYCAALFCGVLPSLASLTSHSKQQPSGKTLEEKKKKNDKEDCELFC